GVRLVQLRAKSLSNLQLRDLAWRCDSLASSRGVRLLLNGPAAFATELGLPGLHLTSAALMAAEHRPLPGSSLVGASCHSAVELAQAERIGVDFACLSPVKPTRGYQSDAVLGMDGFARLVAATRIPVYALGGMEGTDLEAVVQAGGQGIAGISAFWRT
ncbi:MAG: thiamine phosphate synthase, partial [Xanthomonadales bacterium]|nr:thiamine phosphate synthase [Xanthomonadales bacterium]